jgi:hypothetical protein
VKPAHPSGPALRPAIFGMMRKQKRKTPSIARPKLGRNLAVRPGAGAHAPDEEKRAADKIRREIEEQREHA